MTAFKAQLSDLVFPVIFMDSLTTGPILKY